MGTLWHILNEKTLNNVGNNIIVLTIIALKFYD